MTRLHVVCCDQRYVSRLGDGSVEVGYWELHPADARRMIGGTIYLHRTKRRGAYDGGQVLTVRVATEGEAHPGQAVFRYRPTESLRHAAWEGDTARQAMHGTIIDETAVPAAAAQPARPKRAPASRKDLALAAAS